MNRLSELKIGDEVVYTNVNRRGVTRKYTVTKVGRKLIHAGGETFERERGWRNDAYRHGRIQHPQDYADEIRREEKRNRVKGRLRLPYDVELTEPQLDDLIAVIEKWEKFAGSDSDGTDMQTNTEA